LVKLTDPVIELKGGRFAAGKIPVTSAVKDTEAETTRFDPFTLKIELAEIP